MEELLELTQYHRTTVLQEETIHEVYLGQDEWQTECWRRGKELGHGGYGTVWLEREQRTSRVRAVKRVSTKRNNGSSWDYRKEIEAMAKARRYHQYFAYFYGWYENESHVYLAMEYFELGDLSRYLDKQLPEEEAKGIARKLLGGLKEMHRMGITHRDLKPQNIFVRGKPPPEWDVRIGDFGIAKRVQGDETELRTQTGTKDYMAPEMFPWLVEDGDDTGYTQAVDIWAIGIIVFQMITLKFPFNEGNPLPSFVRGKSVLPEVPLREAGMTSAGIHFVKDLLRPTPQNRPCSKDAMQHIWLEEVIAGPKKHQQALSGPANRSPDKNLGKSSMKNSSGSTTAGAHSLTTNVQEPYRELLIRTQRNRETENRTAIHSPSREKHNSTTSSMPDDQNPSRQYVAKDESITPGNKHMNGWQESATLKTQPPGMESRAAKDSIIQQRIIDGFFGASDQYINNSHGHESLQDRAENPPKLKVVGSSSRVLPKRISPPTPEDVPLLSPPWKGIRVFNMQRAVQVINFSSNGRVLAIGCASGVLALYEVGSSTLACQYRLSNDSTDFTALHFTSHQNKLSAITTAKVSGGLLSKSQYAFMRQGFSWEHPTNSTPLEDDSIDWQLRIDWKQTKEFAFYDKIYTLTSSSDGKLVVSAGNEQVVRIWDAVRGVQLHTQASIRLPQVMAFSIDNTLLARVNGKGVSIKSVLNGRLETSIALGVVIQTLAFSHDGQTIAIGTANGQIVLWEWMRESKSENEKLKTIEDAHSNIVCVLTFSPDDTLLASGASEKIAKLWNLETRKKIKEMRHSGPIRALAFSPDSKLLASGSSDGKLKIWSTNGTPE